MTVAAVASIGFRLFKLRESTSANYCLLMRDFALANLLPAPHIESIRQPF